MPHRPCQSDDSYREPSVQNLSANRTNDSLAWIYAPHSREYSRHLEGHIP